MYAGGNTSKAGEGKIKQGKGEGGRGRLRAGARILLITAGRMPALPRGRVE